MASEVQHKAPIGSLVKIRTEKETPKPVPIKRVGKRTQAWLKFRQQWIRDNPPDWLSNYTCTLCGRPVHKTAMQLDHIERRGSHPDKVLQVDNVRPVCGDCNFKRET